MLANSPAWSDSLTRTRDAQCYITALKYPLTASFGNLPLDIIDEGIEVSVCIC